MKACKTDPVKLQYKIKIKIQTSYFEYLPANSIHLYLFEFQSKQLLFGSFYFCRTG